MSWKWTIRDSATPTLYIAKESTVSKQGIATVGSVTCVEPDGCKVTANSAQLKVGSKRFNVSFTLAGSMTMSESSPVTLALKGKALKAFKAKGKGKLSGVNLAVTSEGGAQATYTGKIKLKMTAG